MMYYQSNFWNKINLSFLLIFCLVTLSQKLMAQQGTGLILNPEAYEEMEVTPKKLGRGFRSSSFKHSLKKYCPKPGSQGKLGSCVGYATGYGAMTISHAIVNNITDANANRDKAFSALFIYNQINNAACGSGTQFKDALEFIKENGNHFYANYDLPDKLDCEKEPTQTEKQFAKKYGIESYLKLFESHENAEMKIGQMRSILASNYPVIVGMMVGDGLRNAGEWWETSISANEGHAMLIVGYDDEKEVPHSDSHGAFEVMNSHGSKWGKDGFSWISYKEFAETVAEAYYFKIKEVQEIETDERLVKLSGDFQFKSVSTFGSSFYESQAAVFQERHYELEKRNWPVYSKFQLFTNNIRSGEYLYVFSVSPDNAAYVHWPENSLLDNRFGAKESPLIPNNRAEVIIPGETTALEKYMEGNDYLFILYCDKPYKIDDLKSKIQKMSDFRGDKIEGFYSIFNQDLIPLENIEYTKSNMSIKVDKKTSGFVAPIILRVGTE